MFAEVRTMDASKFGAPLGGRPVKPTLRRPVALLFGRRASPFLAFRALEKRIRGGAGRLRSRGTHGPRHLAAPGRPGGEPDLKCETNRKSAVATASRARCLLGLLRNTPR